MSKTTLTTLLGVCLILVLTGSYFFFTKHNNKEGLISGDASILLYVEEGDVSYRNPDMGNFQKATSSPVVIANHAQVFTGLGTATILFPNNSSTHLDHYTELTVSYEDSKVSLLQTLGTTYHRVEAIVTGGSYEVETPGTLAAVRGTKFAVRYDKQTRTTKVAVTEHQVAVSKFKSVNASSTKEIESTLTLGEGKTVRVRENTQATSSFDVVDTQSDTDMKVWVEENKSLDDKIDTIKNTASKEEFRAEIKNIIKEDSQTPQKDEVEVELKEETKKPEDNPKETNPKFVDTTPQNTKKETETKPSGSNPPTSPVKKIDEEVFFDKFNDLFTTYFYLDDRDTPCSLNVDPASRVRLVSSYASESGYSFTSKTLASFAVEVNDYCGKKDPSIKARLQARFDAEYPFKEDL